jgi:hypothetical protein
MSGCCSRATLEQCGTRREPSSAVRRPTPQATLPSEDDTAENAGLQRENEGLRKELNISIKSIAVYSSEMRFRFIENRRADYPVTIMAFNMPRRSIARRCSPPAFGASMSRGVDR